VYHTDQRERAGLAKASKIVRHLAVYSLPIFIELGSASSVRSGHLIAQPLNTQIVSSPEQQQSMRHIAAIPHSFLPLSDSLPTSRLGIHTGAELSVKDQEKP
jgi:hypothetical protein